MRFGVRPTTMVFGRDSRKPWGKWDRLLAEAYEILEGERCPSCGYPIYICHAEDGVEVSIEEDTCTFAYKKGTYNTGREKGKKKELPEGTTLTPRAFYPDGRDPSEFRAVYYEALAKKREAQEASRIRT